MTLQLGLHQYKVALFVDHFVEGDEGSYRPKWSKLLQNNREWQWLWEETSVLKVMSSNPSTIYWMDIFSHTFDVQIVMFVWKDRNKRKRGLGWLFQAEKHKLHFQVSFRAWNSHFWRKKNFHQSLNTNWKFISVLPRMELTPVWTHPISHAHIPTSYIHTAYHYYYTHTRQRYERLFVRDRI